VPLTTRSRRTRRSGLLFCSRWIAASAAAALIAGAAHAGEGVIEINQTAALAGGLNGSLLEDPPGFPVRIRAPGSYRLTSDLVIAAPATDAIEVLVDGPTIDLGGFTIRGPSGVNVSPPLWQCTGGGGGSALGDGIKAFNSRDVTVLNGRIRNMAAGGLALGVDGRVVSVQAERNCGVGMKLGAGSSVTASQVRGNRLEGIDCTTGCRISDVAAAENGGIGIHAGAGAVVLRSLVRGNARYGIAVDGGSRLQHNVVTRNGANGEVLLSGILLHFGGSNATGNIVSRNQGWGIDATSSDGIALSLMDANTDSPVVSGKAIGCNWLSGVVSCPP